MGACAVTKRATFTQAEIERAIRAADRLGKVAVYRRGEFIFLPAEQVPQHAPTESGENTCDKAWGP